MNSSLATHPVAIIGGGPAGLTAAIYLGRAGLMPDIYVGTNPGGQLMTTTEVENFPGTYGMVGPEMMMKIQEQAVHFGAQIQNEVVTHITNNSSVFQVATSMDTKEYKAVVIATGAQALWLGVPGEDLYKGRGVSACATCDGFFYRNKHVIVVGGGDSAMEEAHTLAKFASKVTIVHRRNAFSASKIMQDRILQNPKISIIWGESITEMKGDTVLRSVVFSSGKDMLVDGVFIAIGHKPDTDFLGDIIVRDKAGYILTHSSLAEYLLRDTAKIPYDTRVYYQSRLRTFATQTSVPGIFAAGDCVDRTYRQAVVAAGMGAMAAMDVEKYIQNT